MQSDVRELRFRSLRHGNIDVVAILVHVPRALFIRILLLPCPAGVGNRDVFDDCGADTADRLLNHRPHQLLSLSGRDERAGVVGNLDVGIQLKGNRNGIAPNVNAVVLVGINRLRAVAQRCVVEQDLFGVLGLGEYAKLAEPEALLQTAIQVVAVFDHHAQYAVLHSRDGRNALRNRSDQRDHVDRLNAFRHGARADHDAGELNRLPGHEARNEIAAGDRYGSAIVAHFCVPPSIVLLDSAFGALLPSAVLSRFKRSATARRFWSFVRFAADRCGEAIFPDFITMSVILASMTL